MLLDCVRTAKGGMANVVSQVSCVAFLCRQNQRIRPSAMPKIYRAMRGVHLGSTDRYKQGSTTVGATLNLVSRFCFVVLVRLSTQQMPQLEVMILMISRKHH